MIHIPITNLFNAYDLQINPFDEEKIGLQDVVNYCEARFRVALQAMMKRSEKDQKHMYKLLWGEMVCVLYSSISLDPHATSFRNYVSPTLVWRLRSANHSGSQSLSGHSGKTCTESA